MTKILVISKDDSLPNAILDGLRGSGEEEPLHPNADFHFKKFEYDDLCDGEMACKAAAAVDLADVVAMEMGDGDASLIALAVLAGRKAIVLTHDDVFSSAIECLLEYAGCTWCNHLDGVVCAIREDRIW